MQYRLNFELIAHKAAQPIWERRSISKVIPSFEREAPAGHSIISAFRLSCSILEAYLNHLYSAQFITLPVYTAFNSRTKENITTKRRRSFAFVFTGEALGKRIINTHSLHLNEFGVRMHKYHPFIPSHEKRTVIGSLRNLILTITSHCRTNYLNSSVGTRYHN